VTPAERVEPVGHAVPERDGPSADGVADGRVLTFGVAGDVDAAAEWDRPGVEALRETGLARADDAGEDEVRCSDEPTRVQDPRVVAERTAEVLVLADEDRLAARATLCQEWIRASERGGALRS